MPESLSAFSKLKEIHVAVVKLGVSMNRAVEALEVIARATQKSAELMANPQRTVEHGGGCDCHPCYLARTAEDL